MLPLHSIAAFAEDWGNNVQAVYDAYPDAMSQREGSSNSLPLHLVSSNLDAKPRLIQKIIEHHPRAASLENEGGKLPLHLACEAGKSWEGGLEEIYNAFSNAIRTRENVRGWLPLHSVVSSPHSSLRTIEKILALTPEPLKSERDSLGCTPLHLAVESGKSWDEGGLETLFDVYPDAIDMTDNEGKIPLVTALLAYCPNDVCIGPHDNESQVNSGVSMAQSTLQSTSVFESFDDTDELLREQHLSQINVLFNLLKKAPQVLADHVLTDSIENA